MLSAEVVASSGVSIITPLVAIMLSAEVALSGESIITPLDDVALSRVSKFDPGVIGLLNEKAINELSNEAFS